MSDKSPHSRATILALREAFVEGYVQPNHCPCPDVDGCPACRRLGAAIARRKYPLPRITRPRVVRLADRAWAEREFRVSGGVFQSRTIGIGPSGQSYPWTSVAQITPTPPMIRLLADLLANPTEECEDDS